MTERRSYYRVADAFYRDTIPINKSGMSSELYMHPIPKTEPTPSVSLRYKTLKYTSTKDPRVWGPAMWFTLHNGAAHYPNNPSDLVKQRMKGFIMGLPYMVVCDECSKHAWDHIQRTNLDHVVSSQSTLFKFFWGFHNYVNKRYNKPIMSLKEAENIYMGGANVTNLEYA